MKSTDISTTSIQEFSIEKDSDLESNSTNTSPPRSPRSIPIPKDNKIYAQAKRAEHEQKNLVEAEVLYKKAIKSNDRKLSAIKDLASLLNQTNRTKEAIILLKSNEKLFKSDKPHYSNLVTTLENHLKKQDKSFKKTIKISYLPKNATKETVLNLFSSNSRIQDIFIGFEITQGKANQFCIIHFNSQSSARKTLEGFGFWDDYTVQWVTESGRVLCDAHYAKQKIENHRISCPTFDHVLFDKDPAGHIFCLAIDDSYISEVALKNAKTEERLLGSDLLKLII